MKKYICNVFGKSSFDEITINNLFGILERKPKAKMTVDEIRQFKIAIVICLVTKFLAPISLNIFISTSFSQGVSKFFFLFSDTSRIRIHYVSPTHPCLPTFPRL